MQTTVPKTPSGPHRRAFISQALLGLADLYLVLPTVNALVGLTPEQPKSETDRASKYVLTDQAVTLFSGAKAHLLGVNHNDEELALWGNYFKEKILAYDVVTLERCRISNDGKLQSGSPLFFDEFAAFARDSGKVVFGVDECDTHRSWPRLAATFGSGLLPVARWLYLFNSLADKAFLPAKDCRSAKTPGIAGKIETCGVAALYGSALTAQTTLTTQSTVAVVDTAITRKAYSGLDVSYISDARTVFMLDCALRVDAQNPDRKMLIMIGDYHAQGILHYLQNPQQFYVKLDIYNGIYKKIFGDSMRKLET